MTHDPSRTGTPRDGPRSDDRRATLGRRGEDLAAGYFAARGYQIVARNVRADRVELDLIVRRGDTLAFVEVKTRRSARHGAAAEAVDARKQHRLRRGARAWLAGRPPAAQGVRRHRFDVVTCVALSSEAGAAAAADPDTEADAGRSAADAARSKPRNATSAPDGTRWSIEHWESAF